MRKRFSTKRAFFSWPLTFDMQNQTHLSPVHGWSTPIAENGCSPLQRIGQEWVKMVLKMSQNNSKKWRYCTIKTTVSCTQESHHMHTHHCAFKLKSKWGKIHPVLFSSLNGKYDDMSWFYIVFHFYLYRQKHFSVLACDDRGFLTVSLSHCFILGRFIPYFLPRRTVFLHHYSNQMTL